MMIWQSAKLMLGHLIGKNARDLERCRRELASVTAQYKHYLALYIRWHEKAVESEQELNQIQPQYRLLQAVCRDIATRTCDLEGEPVSPERIRGALRKALKGAER